MPPRINVYFAPKGILIVTLWAKFILHELQATIFLHRINGHGFLLGNTLGTIPNYGGMAPMTTLDGPFVSQMLTVAHLQTAKPYKP